MSLFKKITNHPLPRAGLGNTGPSMSNSNPASGYGSTNGQTIVESRSRSGTDPETCLEVFKSHWAQVWAVMNGLNNNASPAGGVPRNAQESVNTVLRYVDQMVLLLIEEESGDGGAQGQILQFLLEEDILMKVISWSDKQHSQTDRLKLHHLKMFDMIISQAQQQIFVHKPALRPLLKLLTSCEEDKDNNIEQHLIIVLGQLCVAVTRNTSLLEVLFSASTDQGVAKFLIFSLLIPYIHREGTIGQQARDALLLIMALSARHDHIGQYIAQNSDFCPVLATGLSGLYSSLPRKMNPSVDDWFRIREEDINKCSDLIMFLNSLEFCNAVVQVAHPLVAEQLLSFIYHGFLVPVMAPALHQNDIILNEADSENEESLFEDDASSMEEVIAATAYLDLFIRRVSEPNLIRVFVQLVVMEKYDDTVILDSLITRIQSNSRLCMVTMALFKTLVELNCEDVMFQLIFRHLIPCTHVMVSQRRAVRDLDLYGKTAEKLLALRPNCCAVTSQTDMTSSQTMTPQASPALSHKSFSNSIPDTPTTQRKKRWRGFGKSSVEEQATNTRVNTSAPPPPQLSEAERQQSTYYEYLSTARPKVTKCAAACKKWSAPYDGEDPSPDSLQVDNMDDSVTSDGNLSGIEPLPAVKDGNNKDTVDSDNRVEPISGNEERVGGHKNDAGVLVNSNIEKEKEIASGDGTSKNVTDVRAMQPNKGPENDVDQPGSINQCKTEQCSDAGYKNVQSAEQDKSSHPPTTLPLPGSLSTPCDMQPSQESAQDDSAESTLSAVDSAISGLTGKSADLSTVIETRSDSPMQDNFDNAEFNSFLLMLKRTDTPVEFSESMEDCLKEIEILANEYKKSDVLRNPKPIRRLVSELISPSMDKILRDALTTPDEATDTPAMGVSKSISMIMPVQSNDITMTKSLSMDTIATSIPTKTLVANASSTAPIFTPTKYNLGNPDIGPFMSTLLGKLEAMMQNSLYVNLLLTDLVTRLACYPQPLLRSFLLNHTLVFQPTVKSLLQVLGSVKHKVDAYAHTVKGFDTLMLKARQFLAWRESSLQPLQTASTGQGRMRSDSNLSIAPGMLKEKKKGSSIGDFFRRNLTPQKPKPQQNQSRLQLLNTGTGFRYIHRLPSPDDAEENPIEALKAKNAVYCAIVLEEFVKELAAISQEHAILHVNLMPS